MLTAARSWQRLTYPVLPLAFRSSAATSAERQEPAAALNAESGTLAGRSAVLSVEHVTPQTRQSFHRESMAKAPITGIYQRVLARERRLANSDRGS